MKTKRKEIKIIKPGKKANKLMLEEFICKLDRIRKKIKENNIEKETLLKIIKENIG